MRNKPSRFPFWDGFTVFVWGTPSPLIVRKI